MRTVGEFFQDLLLYTMTAVLSFCVIRLVLVAIYKLVDPKRAAKKGEEKKIEIAKRFGRSLFMTNSYEDIVARDVINPDDIDVKLESIGGLDACKQQLYELIILPLRRPELFCRGKLMSPQKGVLLYGPPGTGKTMLAKAIAKESGAVFINLRVSNLIDKWMGESEKLTDAVFSLANKLQPSIIFIDEADSFLGQRKSMEHGMITSMKTVFLASWDGFSTDSMFCIDHLFGETLVMVLAATNRPSELDEAILRRLPQAFEIGMPDLNARIAILKVILKDEKVEDAMDYEYIGRKCDGYSGSDLFELCKKAAYFPIRDFVEDQKARKITKFPFPGLLPLSQLDLEIVISTTTKTNVAASQYSKTTIR